MTTRVARSMSEFRRLTAQGVDVSKPVTPFDPKKLKLVFISDGLKKIRAANEQLPKADVYIDCRGMFEEDKYASGSHPSFQAALNQHNDLSINAMIDFIEDGFKMVPRRRRGEDVYARPYVICTLCAYGIHRSVGTKAIISQYFKAAGFDVEVK